MRFLVFALFLFVAVETVEAESPGSPPSLYVSKGACPFECCMYREWTANRDLELMDHPGGKPIAQIRKHDIVSARTGEVRTHPLRSTSGLALDINGGRKLKSIPAKSGGFK